MMLDELYRMVIDDPDADAPRVAYAAACDAAGDRDRAEFIRIQMATVDQMRRGSSGWEFVDREEDGEQP